MTDNIEKRDAEREVEAQFVDPTIVILIFGFIWYVLGLVFQAVCSWLGIQLFKTMWKKISRLWKKDKDGENEGTLDQISEEESAASANRTLHR